jgi:periplasmic divalent cation tolerance protein
MKYSIIYTTTRNEAESKKIAEALIKEKLVACANIIPRVFSIYEWQGKIEEENESSIIMKTRQNLVKETIARIKELHSYDVPGIEVIDIVEGNDNYFEWIEKVTKK